jgi:hypothetical protein
MARKTASDIDRRLRKAIGNPTTDEWTSSDSLRCMNDAVLDIATVNWRDLPSLRSSTDVTTTSGTATYELSATDINMLTEEAYNVTDGIRLRPTNRLHYDRVYTSSTGTVHRWFETEGLGSNSRPQVTYWLTPNGTKTIRHYYVTIPTEMVIEPTATSSPLPQRFDNAVETMAIEKAKILLQQYRDMSAVRDSRNETLGIASAKKQPAPEQGWSIESPFARATRRR